MTTPPLPLCVVHDHTSPTSMYFTNWSKQDNSVPCHGFAHCVMLGTVFWQCWRNVLSAARGCHIPGGCRCSLLRDR